MYVAWVEHEFGAFVDDDYPLMKFWNQVDFLKMKAEAEEKEMNKGMKGGGSGGKITTFKT